jgi:hypothetical protein
MRPEDLEAAGHPKRVIWMNVGQIVEGGQY